MKGLKFVFYKYYYLIRLFIAKNCVFLSRIPFVYRIFQNLFRIPNLENSLKYINNTNELGIKDIFYGYEEEIIIYFDRLKNTRILYILLPFPHIGEYALSFILLRQFLLNYKGDIYVICSENTLDIAKIYGIYFDIKNYITIPMRLSCCQASIIVKYLGFEGKKIIDMCEILYKIGFFHDICLKTGENLGYFSGFYEFESDLTKTNKRNSKLSRKGNYKYTKINQIKINNILQYQNNEKLIICNFENKSLKSCIDDAIKFKCYLDKIKEISKKYDIKFVINSVYDNEKLYNDENILITRLNFQEIIRLAEHKKIKLFISERNGLNDVFKVFWPEIKQCIIYPDYYWGNVSKKIFKKKLDEQYNLINFYSLMSDNVCELIREDFDSTIENKIKILGI